MGFNVTVQKFTDMASDSMFQLPVKKFPVVSSFGVVSENVHNYMKRIKIPPFSSCISRKLDFPHLLHSKQYTPTENMQKQI